MADRNIKYLLVAGFLGLAIGLLFGSIYGLERGKAIAPKNEYIIYQNRSLALYDYLYYNPVLPDDMTGMFKVEHDGMIIFLWTSDYLGIRNGKLNLRVMRK